MHSYAEIIQLFEAPKVFRGGGGLALILLPCSQWNRMQGIVHGATDYVQAKAYLKASTSRVLAMAWFGKASQGCRSLESRLPEAHLRSFAILSHISVT